MASDRFCRRTLVTGAAGFVGANLVRRLLRDGHEVIALVREGTDRWRLRDVDDPALCLCEADLDDPAATSRVVHEHGPKWVFHLATSRAWDDPVALTRTNVVGTAALLTAVAAAGAERLVYAGSSFEYGDAATPYRETARPRPTTVFGATRVGATALVEQHRRAGTLDTRTLRLFHVYGPWEAGSRLVPRAIRAAIEGTRLPLTPPGFSHDFVHVDDVVEALLRAAERPGGPPLNICTGRSHTNEFVVDVVEELTGRAVRRDHGAFPPRPWDRRSWVGDPEAAAAQLDWVPKHDLRIGIADTLAWWRQRDAG